MRPLFEAPGREERFKDLVISAQHCNLCPRLCAQRKVLSDLNGSIYSKVIFVAEAPGRLGADRTGVPLHGDRTGANFECLLANIGWKREDVFITNAVLCNPKNDGRNAPPTKAELTNCSAYLEMTLALVEPEVVVTLGAKALEALSLISPHAVKLQLDVARRINWNNRILFPLYHPGPRALIHRSLSKQRKDFILLSGFVDPIQGVKTTKKPRVVKSPSPGGVDPTLKEIILAILNYCGEVSLFKLTKLLYFVDYLSLKELGYMPAANIYLRRQDGPWPPELRQALDTMNGKELFQRIDEGMPVVGKQLDKGFATPLNDDVLKIVQKVVNKYGCLSNAAIKSRAYCTKPMRDILRNEKEGAYTLNTVVLYSPRKDTQSYGMTKLYSSVQG